jgi:hypothetical protein
MRLIGTFNGRAIAESTREPERPFHGRLIRWIRSLTRRYIGARKIALNAVTLRITRGQDKPDRLALLLHNRSTMLEIAVRWQKKGG